MLNTNQFANDREANRLEARAGLKPVWSAKAAAPTPRSAKPASAGATAGARTITPASKPKKFFGK